MKKRISSLLAIVLTIAILASTFVTLGMQSVSAANAEYDVVTIGDSNYLVEKTKYNARDTLWDLVDEMDPAEYLALDMSSSVWQVRIRRYKPDYVTGYTFANSHYGALPAILPTCTSNSAWNTKQNQSSVVFHSDGTLAVNPWVADDATAAAYIDLDFHAPKDGKVVIYDLLGGVKSPTANNLSPYWAWLAGHKNMVSVTILKNGTQIWPTDDTTDNMITDVGDVVKLPDLGAIEVVTGDMLTVRILETNAANSASRDVVFTDPEIAYIYEIPVETERMDIGDNVYFVNKNENYDLYSDFTSLTDGMTPGNPDDIADADSLVSFTNNWSMAYQYTTKRGFGLGPWGGTLSYEYGKSYNSLYQDSGGSWVETAYEDLPEVYGIQTAYYMSINNWGNCFYNSAVMFIPESERLYISPNAQSLSASTTDADLSADVIAPAMKIAFTAYRDGNVLLYDKSGEFSGEGVTANPYWANESDNAKTTIKIYKNDELIWPTDGEEKIINSSNTSIAFPDLGEIAVEYGDEISIVFYANASSPNVRTGVFCNPAVAYIDENPVVPVIDVEDNVVLGDKNYTVYSDKKYNAYDTFCGVVEGKTAAAYTTSADELSTINRLSFADTGWAASYTRGGTTYYTPVYINGQTNVGTSFNELYFPTGTSFIPYYNASIIYDQTAGMVINPGNSWAESKHFSLTYTASETGSIVLYDTDGKLTTPLKDELPYYCWTSSTAYVDVTVYKNDTVIWPLASEDNRLDKASDILEFPAIELNVSTGDVVTVTFATGSSVQRVPVVADLEVAYIHEHTSSVTETESTYYKDGIRDGLCYECGNTYENAPIYNAEAAATLDKSTLSYNPVTDVLSLTVKYGAGFVLDYYASEEYNPSVSMKYSIGGKTYNYSNYTFADDGVEFELSGINNTRLNTKMTIELSINWAGNTDGELYIDKASDTFATFSFFPCDVIATGETEAEQAAISAFNELTTTVTSAKSEDANVSAQLTTSDYFTVKQADLNVKDGTAIIWIKINDQFKKMIKDNTEAGYNEQGRKAVFTITIGGKEYTVEKSSINVGITVKISGLSYAQMFGEISVQMKVEYVDERATDIITDVVTHNFATAITDSDSLAAAALEAYMTAKSAVQS